MALLTVDEAKDLLAISGTGSDVQITALLPGLSAAVETYCGQKFSQAEVTEYDDGGGNHLFVSRLPIVSIASITDRIDGYVVPVADYGFDGVSGTIWRLPYGEVWAGPGERFSFVAPGYDNRVRQRWQITYTGGPSTAPDDVKLACAQLLAARLAGMSGMKSERDGDYSYERASDASGMPVDVQLLLGPYRARRVV